MSNSASIRYEFIGCWRQKFVELERWLYFPCSIWYKMSQILLLPDSVFKLHISIITRGITNAPADTLVPFLAAHRAGTAVSCSSPNWSSLCQKGRHLSQHPKASHPKNLLQLQAHRPKTGMNYCDYFVAIEKLLFFWIETSRHLLK